MVEATPANTVHDRVLIFAPTGRDAELASSALRNAGFIAEATRAYPNVRAEPFDVLVVDFARRNGARTIVKGLRAISDFEYEFEMNQLNRHQAPDIDTLYLMASPKYSFLSSSGVKELATFGGDVDEYVPATVVPRLKEELAR